MNTLIKNNNLKWIFVSGKGGVGKTTFSCSLGIELAKVRESVLIISTDPAHNLSDAFAQKFNHLPGKVNGIDNLYCMEFDTGKKITQLQNLFDTIEMNELKILSELFSKMPGIEEAVGYISLMKKTADMPYSVIIFDSSPTGHALKLLSYPEMIKSAYDKLVNSTLSNMLNIFVRGVWPSNNPMESKLEALIGKIHFMNDRMTDSNHTLFIPVCIPEFLSVFETERMIQEIYRIGIESNLMVVNQVIDPDKNCQFCQSRSKMQKKYLDIINDLYLDIGFTVLHLPLLKNEIRTLESLQQFTTYLYKTPAEKNLSPENILDLVLEDFLIH